MLVQTGNISVEPNSKNNVQTITLSTVDTSKSFIIVSLVENSWTGKASTRAYFHSSTSFKIESTTSTTPITVYWQVVTFA